MDHTQNLTIQFKKLDMKPSPTIPLDIITDILIQLPAKPLLRFKSVCKSWYNLINGPDFINRHLHQSLTTNSNLHFVFGTPVLHLGNFDTFENTIELNYPFKRLDIGGASIISYCNGLLCFMNGYHHFIIAFYNPTTRTYKILPSLHDPPQYANLLSTLIYGFGYDSVTDDYKFVSILKCVHEETNISYREVMVYSFRLNSWARVLVDVPSNFSCRCEDGAFVNGCLHWANWTKLDQPPLPIVGFNVSTHDFFEFEMPVHEIDMEMYCYMHAGVLDECLCIVLNYMSYYEIWVMKEYGVVESWTKLYRVGKAREIDAVESLVAFTKNRKELLVRLCLHRVTSIDLETLVIEHVEVFRNPTRCWEAYVCAENLLMLEDLCDTLVTYEQQERQRATIKKRRKRKGRRRRN